MIDREAGSRFLRMAAFHADGHTQARQAQNHDKPVSDAGIDG
jgi:hypothetical protein